jgi:hypothetical protein
MSAYAAVAISSRTAATHSSRSASYRSRVGPPQPATRLLQQGADLRLHDRGRPYRDPSRGSGGHDDQRNRRV